MFRVILTIPFSLIAGIITFVLWNFLCSRTVISSPDNHDALQRIYILSYKGYHNSLLIFGDNGWKEFSYGDWDVYGKSKINFWTGFKSMGIPSQGALGFRNVKWNGMDESNLFEILKLIRVISINVDSKKVKNLYLELENLIETNSPTGVFNPINNLFFVFHPKNYMAWHTCNNMLIEWLEGLDVKTSGNGWAGNFILGN